MLNYQWGLGLDDLVCQGQVKGQQEKINYV